MRRIEKREDFKKMQRSIEHGTDEQLATVQSIIKQVRTFGDQALYELTEKLDRVVLSKLKVSERAMNEAYEQIAPDMLAIIREAAENIRFYHEQQKRQSWFVTKEDGTVLGQKMTPLDAVGVYVPGGTAAYPSSVLMGVIPAKVAGVKRIVLISPPQSDGSLPAGVLVAAKESGLEEIYKVGGAQAIAALAYGTETIQPVDKIVGPGNIFVALAKREVFGVVGIDMLAGPSEIVVLADESANPRYIASDLLSQAEHDPRSTAVLVTTSEAVAEETRKEVKKQLELLPRKDIAQLAIRDYGAVYVASSLEEAVDVVNELAPEHLEVMVEEPFSLLSEIRHAGAIFLGEHSSEPVGDYFAGTNHVLPTNGTARFSNPLSVDDFVKKSSIVSYSKRAINDNASKIAAFARMEGLEAHAIAVEARLGEKK